MAIGPTGKEEIDLAEKSEHRWDAAQREQAKAEPQSDQRVFLIEAGVVGNAIAAGSQREQDHAGEGPQIHEQVGRHVEHHRGEAFFGAADQADHHEARLADGAVGQHPLHGCLRQGHNVAQGHAEHGQHCEQQLPLGLEAFKAAHQQAQSQGETSGLGAHREKGHHRCGGTLIDIGGPLVEGHGGDFEGHRGQHKHQSQSTQRCDTSSLQGDGDGVEVGGAATDPVKQRGAIQKDGCSG